MDKKKIIVCGATGFVGKNLIPALLNENYDITVLGRDRHKLQQYFSNLSIQMLTWDDLNTLLPDDYAAVINLAGENIGESRWTEKQKHKILNSRVDATNNVVQWCLTSTNKLPHLYNASAIGIYGIQPAQSTLPPALNETDAKNSNYPPFFLVEVAQAWENAALPAIKANHPVTLMRFGVVLKQGEGMLRKIELPYSLGLGSILGSGDQTISWIHIKDLVNAIIFLLKHPNITGPVNLCSPNSILQKTFAATLARSMNRPLFFKLPAFVIEMLFGQMGKELLLGGQHVAPNVLLQNGFEFLYSDLQSALTHEFT